MVLRLRNSPSIIKGNLVGVLFNGLLAELPAILDSFFHQYHKWLHRGGWSGVVGSHEVARKHTLCSYTCIMDPMVLEMAQKVVKSVDNITTKSCETLQPGGLCLTASRNG